ncbi:MAG: DUF2807 domain-containing protein [Bacteroidales bacterium]|nr:DUF2807 domain-containing protein [Bacteroidales bacterium]
MKKLIILLLTMPFPLFITNTLGQNTNGNGKVVEDVRTVEKFSALSAEEGINLVLTQSTENKVIVITDENLQDKVITEVENGNLKIYPKDIKNATKLIVKVEFKEINALSAKEGVDLETTNTLTTDNLALSLKEGCDAKMDVNVKNLACSLKEGCDMKLNGEAKSFSLSLVEGSEIDANINGSDIALSIVEGSEASLKGIYKNAAYSIVEGSELKAFDLLSENVTVSAVESSEAEVQVTKSLIVSAKEGSEVKYKGNPEDKQISSCENCEVKAQ